MFHAHLVQNGVYDREAFIDEARGLRCIEALEECIDVEGL
jgi:hypothetical protein